MNGTKGGDTGLRELSRIMEGGTVVSTTLKQLHLNDCDIGPQGRSVSRVPLAFILLATWGDSIPSPPTGIAWLGGAFARGGCPALEELYLSKNEKLGAEGIRYLATALRDAGSRCQLRILDIRWTEMGLPGAECLAIAFQSHACPKLEVLHMMQVCLDLHR